MPTLHFHRRHLRRTAWVTLVAWVLATLVGVASACQLGPNASTAPGGVAAASDLPGARGVDLAQVLHTEHRDHAAPTAHEGGTRDPAQAGCLKFCKDRASTVAKGKTVPADVPGAMPAARIDWPSTVAAADLVIGRSAKRPASQGPPLVIRFLRLTL
jgi:hypothetical protein